ncbi:unnamed protein product, partial [Protopolystoma xenopodis]
MHRRFGSDHSCIHEQVEHAHGASVTVATKQPRIRGICEYLHSKCPLVYADIRIGVCRGARAGRKLGSPAQPHCQKRSALAKSAQLAS